ncbi:uncharacterized protein LOC125945374 isoform X2 [Dermacentor silvarum]|uniref:uncharacterized protein LOC125945374 isoform X2 n=1 Tax=Dermacentor silvarum TaxID=543639 RepID=UPI0021012F8B|nr:uncharacterized protein LOC125945374 isoform X2 [Dermacentor silvarum]
MSEDEWNNNSCLCVKSLFLAAHTDGCERTLECYTYVRTVVGPEQMIIKKENADFRVTATDGITTIHLWTIFKNQPRNIRPSALAHTCTVQVAAQDCLLVTYSPSDNGMQHCLLWGLSREQVDQNTTCYKNITSVCSVEMYDMTESAKNDPCQQFDRDEEEIQEK